MKINISDSAFNDLQDMIDYYTAQGVADVGFNFANNILQQIQLCARNQQIYAQMEGANSLKHSSEYKIREQRCASDLEKLRHGFQEDRRSQIYHLRRP